MNSSGTEVEVKKLPKCDICHDKTAGFDAKSKYGPWAYMCTDCFQEMGLGLGIGRGQRLVVKEVGRAGGD